MAKTSLCVTSSTIGRVAKTIITPLRQWFEAMFGKLFSKATATNEGGKPRYYAVGDIHGCVEELGRLLGAIDVDAETANDDAPSFLIFLGDYVDRGPDSRGVIDRLIALRAGRSHIRFLKGNHEAALLDFLENPRKGAAWLDWGGAETLESYGLADVTVRDEADLAEEFRRRLPAEHLAFLNALETRFETEDVFFVHAGIKPGVPLAEQAENDLLWIRGEFHSAPVGKRPEKTIVHGHHPVKKPQDAGWRINVDTGACWTGKLTAVVIEGKSRRFLST
ncbi:MAG: metallophosphoesterase family protein [Planctomycetota bacterium]